MQSFQSKNKNARSVMRLPGHLSGENWGLWEFSYFLLITLLRRLEEKIVSRILIVFVKF